MSNSLGPDQAQIAAGQIVGPDLGLNCFQSLSEQTTLVGKELKAKGVRALRGYFGPPMRFKKEKWLFTSFFSLVN